MVSVAQKRATQKYNKESYDRISVFVPKGMRNSIKERAKTKGKSMNSFIYEMILNDLANAKPSVVELIDHNDFSVYKSNVCHYIKNYGDLLFIKNVIEEDSIQFFYEKKRYKECLYLLAALDYISRENDIPLYTKYEFLRHAKLKTLAWPKSVLMADEIIGNDMFKDKAMKKAIPEFLRHNIVEGDIRNVV